MDKRVSHEKPLSHFLSRNVTLEDLTYLGSSLVANGIKIGGVIYAIAGTDDNHIANGILLYASGKLLDYGGQAIAYLKKIHDEE
ncbi:hypothetical protein CMI42_04440 [Candidatus Pacearchaeota archaeon]|nr:hypothetical protein [Candidatus Pacearchaeota archaeon]